ncbi:MAG: NAD(P)-binding protein [Arenicellales bacterium]|nr:NAD(P)-binding protein [Arenicellales bacterium]
MSDLARPFAITLDVGTSLTNETGSWRTRRPVYVDRLPPCNNTCPAGENIQAWLYLAEEGDYEGAWQEILKNNPLPAVMGRACYHTCEGACNRGAVDEAVGIHAVERFLGDEANKQGWMPKYEAKPSGKKVLVVGAGPAGLACAYHLTRMGHAVTIADASDKAGGLLRYGIPRYRLPSEALDGDIKRIEKMGVSFQMNTYIEDLLKAREAGGYDALFVAIGAQLSRDASLPGDESIKAPLALKMLRQVEEDSTGLDLGRRVAVYGGGNTAMDVARSAVRLGAETTIVYRRSQEQMPAHDFEIKEALEEGACLRGLRTIARVEKGALALEEMTLDEQGKPQPTGRFESLQADTVVLAIGQEVETHLVEGIDGVSVRDGVVEIDEHMMTGHQGVFAGGDMVPSDRTMTSAIGHGKKAAHHIDAWLRGETYAAPPKHGLAAFENLNAWYYADAPKTIQPVLELIRRQSGFEEVLGNLDEANALYEARRCLSCGNCFECDTCYGICPDNAVNKLGPGKRFEFKYDYCKGCGLCVAECPCGAIEMVSEDI